jgi:hypothetical protein
MSFWHLGAMYGTSTSGSLNGPLSWTKAARQRNRVLIRTLVGMFFFFSNRMGLAGSILVSLLLSVVLLYACSRA